MTKRPAPTSMMRFTGSSKETGDDEEMTLSDCGSASIGYNVASRLLMGKAGLAIESTKPRPNRWHRFWYWVFLGWQWESVGK